jgi:hypothetical protein
MPEPVLFLILSIILLVVPIVGTSYVVLRVARWANDRDQERMRARKAARDLEADQGVYLDERKVLKTCSNCDVFAFTLPFQDEQGRTFCSTICRDYVAARRPGFCARCEAETADEHVDTHMNELGMGWTFGGPRRECDRCHSSVRTLWVKLLLIPILPLGEYRTIQTSPYNYANRRLRRTS